MRDYFARRYSPRNIVLAFAGKSDWGSLVELGPRALRRLARRGGQPSDRPGPQESALARPSSAPTTSSKPSWPCAMALPWKVPTATRHTCWRPSWATTPARGFTGRSIDPGLADGAELSYQDYNQAGAFFSFLSCEPSSTQANLDRIAEGLPRRDRERRHRGRANPGQEQGPRAVGSPQRTPDGPAGVARVPLDVPARLPLGRSKSWRRSPRSLWPTCADCSPTGRFGR